MIEKMQKNKKPFKPPRRRHNRQEKTQAILAEGRRIKRDRAIVEARKEAAYKARCEAKRLEHVKKMMIIADEKVECMNKQEVMDARIAVEQAQEKLLNNESMFIKVLRWLCK